jgi:hypothetical protein
MLTLQELPLLKELCKSMLTKKPEPVESSSSSSAAMNNIQVTNAQKVLDELFWRGILRLPPLRSSSPVCWSLGTVELERRD